MKKLLFISILLSSQAQAKVITLNIPDSDISIVENDVIDGEQWIRDAWAGKLAKCKDRMIKAETNRSIDNGESLPAGADAIIQKAFSRKDYKNRKQREADSQKQK